MGFEEQRRFVRVRPSGLVSRTGTIILDPKKPGVPCKVIDISAGGASLEVANPEQLPKRFSLVAGKTQKSCLIMWRMRYRIGVHF
jgi:hypothetical protein